LVLHGQPLGALVVGHAEADSLDDEDVMFLDLVGSLLTAHVARAKAEDAVRQEREYMAALLDSSSALTLTMNDRGVVTRSNRACLTMSGLRHDEVVGKPFWLSLCVPTEARLAEASFAQLSAEVAAVEFEGTLLTTDGERKYIGWRLCFVVDPRGQAPVIVATGIDMTRQRLAEQEARQAISAAESARLLVDELRTMSPNASAPAQSAVQTSGPSAPEKHPGRRGADRRTSQRKLFPYRQQVAPYENGIIPPRSSFTLARCWDISAGGISFLFDEPPRFKSLVVVLGGPGNEVLMSAEIVRLTEISEQDAKGVLVGCRFTGKL
jgi:PAS domain S-box-containing protein